MLKSNLKKSMNVLSESRRLRNSSESEKRAAAFKAFSCFFLVVLLVANTYTAHCHPHAFVVTSYTVVFDDQGLKGIRVSWVFDEMYSATTATEFDTDGDGSFSKTESEELISLGNESLPQLNYFTNIHIDGKPFEVEAVRDFTIKYDEGILTYDFFIDCSIKASPKMKKVKISPYDKEFYLAMLFNENKPFTLENSEQYNVQTNIGDDLETLIYFDSMHPVALHLEFQSK